MADVGWRDVAKQTDGSRGRWVVELNCMQIPIYWRGAAAVCVRLEKVLAAPKGTICVSHWVSTRNSHLVKSSFWHARCHIIIWAVWHVRQGSLVRKHTLSASVVTAAQSFLWSMCDDSEGIGDLAWFLSQSFPSSSSGHSHWDCALGLPGPVSAQCHSAE